MENLFRKSKDFTKEERSRLLEQHRNSGLTFQEFAKEHSIDGNTFRNWLWLSKVPAGGRVQRTPVERKKILEAYLTAQSSGMDQREFAKVWGVGESTLRKWLRRYEERGSDGLMNQTGFVNGKRGKTKLSATVEDEIVKLKEKEPSFGIKKVSQWLFRFRGVKVSPNSVGKTIRKKGLKFAFKSKKRRRSSDKVRRFERAKPMQLWQSDITQFTLGPSSMRVYLTVFMDDHSRYIVGWRLQSRQTSDLVMDAFKDACVRYGKPEEVLTDQGRQYFAWRGKSELEKYLEKQGIKHVVSRAHHPQTLGKCERFWETVMNEFWTRVKPQDLDEARERLKYFMDHYNHHRPHQGLDGAIPADRFFGIANEIRETISKTVEQNALNMALGELPKAPAFLIGQVGDQKIAFHGTSGSFYLTHENIKGEIENGNGIESRSGNIDLRGEVTENESISKKEFTSQSDESKDEVPSNPDEGIMGTGITGGSESCPDLSPSDHGVLDRETYEEGSVRETSIATREILASDHTGPSGNDNGLTDSATS